ncbi:MAG TPA: hypothetical protein PLJ27_13525 [Polyangiaceae bacterium]|jgi:hypothetical protein|nr:MAG: hypothetical protein BWY17_04131 [Deltaproteobacteria bacterium ADurb.Bin207]HNT00132.1 hypothetical protein [Polyangiaceae bacterium]HNZ22831.1 hypothetical protein [Polyangiaceae bacterium]HOD24309.1 hypothetical protein [Polyangiaceae bacterium]HOE50983.1 hypothetical protein [Polyangiaceae bacterium]
MLDEYSSSLERLVTIGLIASGVVGIGCTHYARLDTILDELSTMSPPWFSAHRDTYRHVLATSLSQDAYLCDPLPSEVFSGSGPQGWRTIRGTMPHYGVYHGPMHYDVLHHDGQWRVEVRYAVELPDPDATLELPDCALSNRLHGPMTCQGIAYSRSGTLDACPDTGTFQAPASQENVKRLLEHWSENAERYYNRDAEAFAIPVHYDFSFTPMAKDQDADGPVHWRLPLDPTCGRTPYFRSMRSGWSLPIVAHEVGHMLGLLDEYEALSGIVAWYPKTAFRGAERSRFGLSMKEESVVLPLHHYLVLRRYFCPEPESRNPYGHGVPQAANIPRLRGLT